MEMFRHKGIIIWQSQLKVNDRMVASTVKHFDVARQMLATYGWSTPLTDEHGDSVFSLAEIHAL